MRSRRPRRCLAALVAVLFALVLQALVVGPRFAAAEAGVSEERAVDASSLFTVEDTDFGILNDEITGKKLTLADGVKEVRYSSDSNRGSGFLVLQHTVGGSTAYSIVNAQGEVAKTFVSDSQPTLSLLCSNGQFADDGDRLFPNMDTLYEVRNPETSKRDIYNATQGAYIEYGAESFSATNFDVYSQANRVVGVTFTSAASGTNLRGLVGQDGNMLYDAAYKAIELQYISDAGIAVYSATAVSADENGNKTALLLSNGASDGGILYRGVGATSTDYGYRSDVQADGNLISLSQYNSEGSTRYAVMNVQTGALVTGFDYDTLCRAGNGTYFCYDEYGTERQADLVTANGIVDATVLLGREKVYPVDGEKGVLILRGCTRSWYEDGIYLACDGSGKIIGSYDYGASVTPSKVVGNYIYLTEWVSGQDGQSGHYAGYFENIGALEGDELSGIEVFGPSGSTTDKGLKWHRVIQIENEYYDTSRTVISFTGSDGTNYVADPYTGKILASGFDRVADGLDSSNQGIGTGGLALFKSDDSTMFGLLNCLNGAFTGYRFDASALEYPNQLYYSIGGVATVDGALWNIEGTIVNQDGTEVATVASESDGSVYRIDKDGYAIVSAGENYEQFYLISIDGTKSDTFTTPYGRDFDSNTYRYSRQGNYAFPTQDRDTGLFGLVSRGGNVILDEELGSLSTRARNGMFYAEEAEEYGDGWNEYFDHERVAGLIDLDGEWLIREEFTLPSDWNYGYDPNNSILYSNAGSMAGIDQTVVFQSSSESTVYYLYDLTAYVAASHGAGRKSVAQATVSKIKDQICTGVKVEPKPEVQLDGVTLVEGIDYTLSYANNTAIGTATIKISGIGDYRGKKTVTFRIVPVPPSAWAIGVDNNAYVHWHGIRKDGTTADPSLAGFYLLRDYNMDLDHFEYLVSLRPSLRWYFTKKTHSDWEGCCYGIAATLGLVHNRYLMPSDIATTSSRSYFGIADQPYEDYKFLSNINYYMCTQWLGGNDGFGLYARDNLESSITYKWQSQGDTLSEFLTKLTDYYADEANAHKAVMLSYGLPSGEGHSVLLTGCTRTSTGYVLDVYDENTQPSFGGVAKMGTMTIPTQRTTFTYDNGDGTTMSSLWYGFVSFTTMENLSKVVYGKYGDSLSRMSSDELSAQAADESTILTVRSTDRLTITNAEGQSLTFDGETFSGDMAVNSIYPAVVDEHIDYMVSTNSSESFTITGLSDEVSLDVGHGSDLMSLETSGAHAATLSEDGGVAIEGSDYSFTAYLPVYDYESDEYILSSVSADATADASVTSESDMLRVVTEGELSDVRGATYIDVDVVRYGEGEERSLEDLVVIDEREPEPEAPFFLDATPGDDPNHGTEVDWMGRVGISTGWKVAGGREYRGMRDVTRCDFAAFLYRLYDLSDDGERNDSPELTGAEVAEVLASVSDCTPRTDHAMEVAWMISSGISKGWPNRDGTVSFRPYANVARQDMAAFLYRFADIRDDGVQNASLSMGSETVTFSDVEHGDTANHAPEVEWLASVGVTKGWGPMKDGTYQFRGTRTVARQDMAAFMYRLYSYLNQ